MELYLGYTMGRSMGYPTGVHGLRNTPWGLLAPWDNPCGTPMVLTTKYLVVVSTA